MTSCARHRDRIELEITEVADDLLCGPTSSPPATRGSSGKTGPFGLEEPGTGESEAACRADGERVHRRIISHRRVGDPVGCQGRNVDLWSTAVTDGTTSDL